jgi:hypothetical protein
VKTFHGLGFDNEVQVRQLRSVFQLALPNPPAQHVYFAQLFRLTVRVKAAMDSVPVEIFQGCED